MKIILDKENKKALINFNDNEIKALKENNNNLTLKGEDLVHFKNHLMWVIYELTKITPDHLSSKDQEILTEEVSKK